MGLLARPGHLPIATAARLLGWQTHEERVLSPTTLRRLVQRHGELIRAAEREETEALPGEEPRALAPLRLVPHTAPRRRSRWPDAITTAAEAALAHARPCPPRGISWAEWARVLEVRRADRACPASDLRHLGPAVEDHQVLVTIDEVLTRAPMRREFIELRTARVATRVGYRYVSGVGDAFLVGHATNELHLRQERTTLAQVLAAQPPPPPLPVDHPLWVQWAHCRGHAPTDTWPPLRLILIWANLAGHSTPELIQWLCRQGVLPLSTPRSGSWLNRAESVQRIIVRPALAGQHPQPAAEIIIWLEETVAGGNAQPRPFVWDGKRRRRRARAHLRRLGGSAAAVDVCHPIAA